MNEALIARMQSPRLKMIRALDGGGIRGMLSVEALAGIENLLRQKLERGDDFVLADHVDTQGPAPTNHDASGAVCLAG